MKNNIRILSAAGIMLALASCKDKSAFTINGEVQNAKDIKKIYLLEADSTNINVVDSTVLSDQNKFSFKKQAPYANLYKLRVGTTIFDFIAKNGDEVGFKTNLADTAHAYEITGSDDSEKIKEFNKFSNIYTEKSMQISGEYEAKAQQLGHESDSLVQAYLPAFRKNMAAYGDEVLKFVNANKNSLAGFYAATSLDENMYEPQLVQYADDIKGKFEGNKGVKQFLDHMAQIKPVSVGHAAPDFTLTDINGKPVKLSDYKGKYVMLDFWASWCVPCRQENPNVVKAYQTYSSKGFNILGISLDEEAAPWKKAIADDKLTWRHAAEFKRFEGPVVRQYKIDAIPSNFIIDPKGVIVAKNVRGADLDNFLNKTFNKAQ